MKIKTTIALEHELLQKLNTILETEGNGSLSDLIDDLLRGFLAKQRQTAHDAADLEVINQNAERLNQEAEDVLTYQMEL